MEQMPSHVPEGYEVQQRLGAGQTSVVWLARQTRTQQSVALKLPRPEALGHPTLRRMFENEVQITLKLSHPNVVRAVDGRSTGADAFLALEYCSGGTLDVLLLERGKLPLDQAVELVRGVALGLAHAHASSVLHRDVKPANVFLAHDGSAKLGDFGTGTFAADAAHERVGTAFYMAPEIFSGESSTAVSDVYSLGVLAYEVLSGVRPFVGDTYEALMVAHLTALPRDLRQQRPELSRAMSAVVMRALSRDATRRFQSVRAFLDAFKAALGEAPSDTSTPLPTGRAGRQQRAVPEPDERAPGGADEGSDTPARGGLFGLFRRRRS